jgi:hypothetical protein
MSRKQMKHKSPPTPPHGGPEGRDETLSFHLRMSTDAPDRAFTASAYLLDVDEASVRMWFYFSEAPGTAPSVVVVPRAMLGRMVLRERPKLRAPMTKWAAKSYPGPRTQCERGHPNTWVYTSNFAHVAVSDVGALIRFFWASPSEVFNTPHGVTAAPVVDVRLPPELLARMWLELDSLAGPDDPAVPSA